jgi:hypothetical protein
VVGPFGKRQLAGAFWSFNILKIAENRVAVPFTSRGLTFFVNPREKSCQNQLGNPERVEPSTINPRPEILTLSHENLVPDEEIA